jgi:hypothetical protein
LRKFVKLPTVFGIVPDNRLLAKLLWNVVVISKQIEQRATQNEQVLERRHKTNL